MIAHKKKILHIRDSSGLYGAERVILTLGRNIDKERFQFSLLCMRRHDASSQELIDAARMLKISVEEIQVRNRLDLHAILRIRTLLKKNSIDIIHTHDFKSDFYGFLSSLCLPVKRVVTAHGSTRDSLLKRLYLFLSEIIVYHFFDMVIAVSLDLKRFLIKRGVSEEKVKIIQNGIDFNIFTGNSSEPHLLDFDTSVYKVFGVVGRLFPDKGHVYFLEAFKLLLSHANNIKALIIGDGPSRDVIRKKILELHLEEHVILTGFQDNIKKFYSILDFLIISSLREGLPYTLLEAMYFKIPVVATQVGDIPILIEHQKTGFLIPPADSDALFSAMAEALDHPENCREYANNAYQKVTKYFSGEGMTLSTEELYEGLFY